MIRLHKMIKDERMPIYPCKKNTQLSKRKAALKQLKDNLRTAKAKSLNFFKKTLEVLSQTRLTFFLSRG